jgi:hypothetical protein
VTVDEITDRLYALPPEEFTQARNQAERKLREAGDRKQADRVKALRRPTGAAGAVNRLVRSHRAQVEAFLEAAARLRDAQVAGKGDLGAAAQAERVALGELVALGGESVRATLEAAAVDDAMPGPTRGKPHVKPPTATAEPGKRRAPARARPDDGAALARLDEAKRKLAAATAEERQARRRWAQTQRELEKAQATIEKAQRELDRLRGR